MKKFTVDIYHQANEDTWTEVKYEGNDPRKAIEVWADLERNYPTCVSINVRRRDEACELIDYAYKHMDWVKGLCSKSRFPYKWSYIENGIGTKYQTGCDTFRECEINGTYYPDQVYPFCLG